MRRGQVSFVGLDGDESRHPAGVVADRVGLDVHPRRHSGGAELNLAEHGDVGERFLRI